ncbi:type I secretion system permease/ATPase [Achromobacter denitrificans]|jgi:ATP-binding cassette subfamily C protein LapB|uniref:Cyclolysin secretion/processing ATP-binding protein CyaB n=2 Tax=Achromobacter denitrificans TaxID=32002 RepID=A0A6N0JN00_ACHDE|nr:MULTISPECIES: type I secretion system permease/ATPase [Achromobacter]ASC68642.1 type I secretion system permease/ATPase [Achromobacter denitrificans]MBV2161879.1 type I secretion system permease/ATPase [Achromobacter denitrificans]MDX3878976.1 type I secretion system permease/ATPase [Achromobacter sp.]QKH40347.1 type I secretion system permease/ATPase [Achromobacter denitrificans]QKH52508.1 type I secretion system permease/ATPase [Achromobacter denitrificans]
MTKMDKLSELAAREWRADARAAHEDPLLDCLVEITRLHGVTATAQALSSGLPLEEHRLTPALLPRAAARAQLSARVVKRELDSISQDLLPAILLLHGERACLLLKKDGGKYVVSHPELGGSSMEMEPEELAAQYTGVVCFVRPQFRFDARAPEVAKVRERHWFWAAIMENRRLYRDALVAALLINIFAMAMPLFTMNVYDRVVPNNAIETLWVLAIGITMVVIFNMILSTARSHVVDSASKRVDVRLSAQIMERVLDLRLEGRPVSVGSFAANLRSFESIRDFIASATITTLVDLPFILLFLLALAWISPWMILPPLVAIVLILLVSLAAQARMESLTMATFQASSQRNATLVEALTGLEAVKTLNAQGSIQRNWERATEFIAQTGGKLKLISSSTVGFVQAVQQMVSISVVIIGVYQAQESAISMGGIIAASMIAGRCLAPLGQVAGLLMQYQNARTSLGSIDNYMKLPVERPAEAEFLHRPVFHGGIEFRDVTFTYPGAAQPALKKVSFKLKPGEKVGVIGRIGSGKTTLEKLALALYQPTEGAVLLDGIDVRQIDPADVRRAIGHVPQDPLLFYGSLKHNLAMGAPYADDASILAAANLAGVSDFANLHPNGFDMVIGERGESLSGGQRQSVAVARALINDPPILLLDEPSSNMDHQSETQLRKRLGEASQTKTILLVTHRTALLDLVDRLIVIDNGHIVADGPKEQVVEALRQGRVGRGG